VSVEFVCAGAVVAHRETACKTSFVGRTVTLVAVGVGVRCETCHSAEVGREAAHAHGRVAM
jgi:hypothetical protein